MLYITKVVTPPHELGIYAWSTTNPHVGNQGLERLIQEIHFSNGDKFVYDHLSSLSDSLSWWLLRKGYKPFGCKFRNSAIVEFRVFDWGCYRLADYLDFSYRELQKEDASRDIDFYNIPFIQKNDKFYGVVFSSLYYNSQKNSLFDIILFGEISNMFPFLYKRTGDIIRITYADTFGKHLWYYYYKITDVKKFDILITKLNLQYQ